MMLTRLNTLMPSLDMKDIARELFLTGVRAADPARAVKRALQADPVQRKGEGHLIVIAFGKAACAMTEQALQHVPSGQNVKAIAVTNYENARDINGCQVMAAGHPLPDQNGIDAGKAVMALLRAATAQDQVLCLISGGGSALLPTPRSGLSLADKIKVNEVLLGGGLDIVQMNRIRQRLSVLKGGGLPDLAYPASVRSLIISDVVGDDLEIIASGPTARVRGHQSNETTLQDYGLWDLLPLSAQTLLKEPDLKRRHVAQNELVCTNTQSLQAIAKAATDWTPRIVAEPLVGDVEEAAQRIARQAQEVAGAGRHLTIWGGETTVRLTGTGRGGRNQELAVRVASRLKTLPGSWVFLSGGTDGRDGPTDAAGGIVNSATIAKAQAQGLDVLSALQNNDSYRILETAGDLLVTGATGTNVADIQLLLRLS